MGHPNSRSFARALNILLERHESETGVEAAVLLADKDSKFSRSFVKVLKRKNVILKTVVGSQKNAHIERVVGFDFKSLLSRLCRESGEPWPSELQRAAATWNARGGVHDSRFSPLEMYLGTNYDAFLADLFRRKPQLERAFYRGPPLSREQADRVFKFGLGEHVRVDLTDAKKRLQQPFLKVSEARTPIWSRGVVEARRLAPTASGTVTARYLVRASGLSGKRGRRRGGPFWTYEFRLRRPPVDAEEEEEEEEEDGGEK